MEIFLKKFLLRVLPGVPFDIGVFRGKQDLLANLEDRLCGYSTWLPEDWRLFVMVDRDGDDCRALKAQLEGMAASAELRTRTRSGGACWQVVNRIVIEELEAWYFGDWQAVRSAYPRVSPSVPRQARYRNPDAVRGGTWEAFRHVMQEHRYFKMGLRKAEAARAIAPHMVPARNRSDSFQTFHAALVEAAAPAAAAPAP